jgi:hypothetical protein
MATLDAPSVSDDLYDSRGDEVSAYRPVFTGDIFLDVALADTGNEPKTVMVLSHPCSMRQGSTLRDRLTVAPVDSRSTKISLKSWTTGHYALMPLPALFPEEDDQPFRYVDSTKSPAYRHGHWRLIDG